MNARGLTPILNVTDLIASVGWFNKLGWTLSWMWGEPPGFACVSSGECRIFLCRDGQGGRGKGANTRTFGESETDDKGVWMSIWVDDVDEVHRQCIEQGLDVTFPPTDMDWQVREMHLRHPDGHVFRVSCGTGSH